MRAAGRGRPHPKLDLPLTNLAATKLAGEYQFANNSVTLHPQLPPVERATGKVSFTESTLTVNDVRGRLFGGPLAVSGGSRPGGGIEVVAKGEATLAGVRPLFDSAWRRYLSGAAAYSATLQVRDGRTRIIVESPLRGVSSALPAPLAKSAPDALPLRIEVVPADGGAGDRISLTLGRLAAVEFDLQRQGEAMVVQKRAIWLTPSPGQPVRLPEQPGTLIYGSLAALNVDRWIALASSDGGGGAAAIDLDVKIGALDVYGKRINEVSMRGAVDAAGWAVMLTARELAGNLSHRSGQLIARLTHLQVPEDYPGAKPQELSQPKDLPAVDLITERFIYHEKELGRVEVVAQPAGEDWRLEKLACVAPEASLTGKGIWRPGSPSRTSADFELAADAQINHGLMAIREFRMRGSAAQVEMSGEVDLANETQNLRVRVVPSLGDSASTVLAFLNPLLVFPAALAQRILKDPLGHIFAFDYSITGTWDDPKVAKMGVNATRLNDEVVPDSK